MPLHPSRLRMITILQFIKGIHAFMQSYHLFWHLQATKAVPKRWSISLAQCIVAYPVLQRYNIDVMDNVDKLLQDSVSYSE